MKYFYTFDHLGSVRELIDSSGNIQGQFDYDPYGRQVRLSGVLYADFGYTGFYIERDVKLDLTWFRAYDPQNGRWLNRDPLGNMESSSQYLYSTGKNNLYEYAKDNPTNLNDPIGLCANCNSEGIGLPTTGVALHTTLEVAKSQNEALEKLVQQLGKRLVVEAGGVEIPGLDVICVALICKDTYEILYYDYELLKDPMPPPPIPIPTPTPQPPQPVPTPFFPPEYAAP